MNTIQPMQNQVSMKGNRNTWFNRIKKSIEQKVIDTLPSRTIKESDRKLKNWAKIDEIISRPAENRAIMGATALVTQPLIDGCNPHVDKETRLVSVFRIISKILAGTAVGVFVVRGPIYKWIEKMTDINGSSKFSKALLPKKHLTELSDCPKYLKNYRSALSMCIALGAMCFTNFLLDAPLTIWLTNLLSDNSKQLAKIREEKQKNKEVLYA